MGYWHGSGTLGHTETHEIVCKERCSECEEQNLTCENYWEVDFETDDWGNISDTVKCSVCNHEYTFEREAE